MPFCKSAIKFFLCLILAGHITSLVYAKTEATGAQLAQLQLERNDEAVYLSATVAFELSPAVQDVLSKSIPLVFVVQAQILRERWYWSDKLVTSATRTLRLAYQPLTRRWRLNVTYGHVSSTGLQTALTQTYDSLDEALQAISHVVRWKIADINQLNGSTDHYLEFRFALDVSQLPRPFQIGIAGLKDWAITVEDKQTLPTKETPSK